MDVSGWTIDQKMRLPDWCFGNRAVFGVMVDAYTDAQMTWFASEIALQAQICIWDLYWFQRDNEYRSNYIRIGLRATVPTSEAEMDEAIPILPYFGETIHTPPRIFFGVAKHRYLSLIKRKGLETGELKVVVEGYAHTGLITGFVGMVYSELPTSMAGWLAHHRV